MKGYLVLGLSLCLTTSLVARMAEESAKQEGLLTRYGLSIIPEPQLVELTEEDFLVDSTTVVSVNSVVADSPAAKSLKEGLSRIAETSPTTVPSRDVQKEIALRLVEESALGLIPREKRAEGYYLKITKERVAIDAAELRGLFYGVQTFLQLLEQGKSTVRGVTIADWPEMEFRAVHVNLWYHLDRPWYYEHLFEQLGHYKINTAVFEFEDKFLYSKHPVLSAPGALTHKQIRDLVEKARAYHIEIVPLVQTMGHVSFIAKHPEFSNLREVPTSNWQLCPLKEGTFELIEDMLEEVVDVVQPAKYFHIGGDEARELGMGVECRQKWGEDAPVESYKLWINFVCNYLKSRGKTAVVWDDMFLKHFSETDMDRLPENLIYMRWNYHRGDFNEQGRKILDLGYPVWIATSSQTMTPIFPDQQLRVFNNANLIPNGVKLGVRGVLNTAWEDAGVHPETYWMGFLSSAEYAWSSATPTRIEFWDKFFVLFYGTEDQRLSKVYTTLSKKGFLRKEHAWTDQFSALALPPLPDMNFRIHSNWRDTHSGLVEEARKRRKGYQEAATVLTTSLAQQSQNKFNQEIILVCAKTMLHFTDLILAIDEIDQNLQLAQADHAEGDDQGAMNRYYRIGRIIDDLRFEKSQLFEETVRIWEKSMYPKDFRHISGGREQFLHQIDRDFYYANKTMDLSYIFEIEEKLGLFAYQQGLYEVMVKILRTANAGITNK